MDRRIIRKRWQVTIPPGIRRRLNLFQGQIINWDIQEGDEGLFIRLFTGNLRALGEDAAYQELFGRKHSGKGIKKCRSKFRKSAEKRTKRLEAWKNPQRFEATELKTLLSDLSQYLHALQGRLEALPGDSQG